ncbi:MAG TPA: FHA domain-containing protein [Planctomycetaceae bacterium]|nr:FHA domain-containing protein [Planctomycetaceae bacterium]
MTPTQNSSASAQFAVSDQSSLSLPVHLVLEVTRGRTRFRRRPVTNPRFLIGAGSTCDLRLGGDRMPALHSIITVAGREIALEAIAAEPVLAVNGRPVQNVTLHDGDVIVIGEVELLARLEAGHAPAGVETPAPAAGPSTEADRPASELSAPELVDLIEREEAQIEDFQQRQQAGAKALVDAVLARAHRRAGERPADAGVRAPVPAPHFLSKRPQILAAQTRQAELDAERDPLLVDELENLNRQLTELSQEIQGNSQRASAREAVYASATDGLLENQEKLVSQLEVLMDQVQTLKASEPPVPKPRAIA